MPSITKNELGAQRNNLLYRGIVVVTLTIGFVICFSKAADAYVKLKDDPPWVKVVTHTINLLVYLAGPVYMFRRTNRWHQDFIRNYADRLGRIEEQIDPKRSTSGLNPDGTDPTPGPGP